MSSCADSASDSLPEKYLKFLQDAPETVGQKAGEYSLDVVTNVGQCGVKVTGSEAENGGDLSASYDIVQWADPWKLWK